MGTIISKTTAKDVDIESLFDVAISKIYSRDKRLQAIKEIGYWCADPAFQRRLHHGGYVNKLCYLVDVSGRSHISECIEALKVFARATEGNGITSEFKFMAGKLLLSDCIEVLKAAKQHSFETRASDSDDDEDDDEIGPTEPSFVVAAAPSIRSSGAASTASGTATPTSRMPSRGVKRRERIQRNRQRIVSHPEVQQHLIHSLANLATEDTNKLVMESEGVVEILIEMVDNALPAIQLEVVRLIATLSEMPRLRLKIVQEGGLIPLIGLSFVGKMYGLVRFHSIRALANLSREDAVRRQLEEQGVLTRISNMGKLRDPMMDPIVSASISSIFSNFSQQRSKTPSTTTELQAQQEPDTAAKQGAIYTLYNLIHSDNVAYIIEGMWALANYAEDSITRKELIETNGLKIVFKLLHDLSDEDEYLQVKYEICRFMYNLATAVDCHDVFVRDKGLEALTTMFKFCLSSNEVTPEPKPKAKPTGLMGAIVPLVEEKVKQLPIIRDRVIEFQQQMELQKQQQSLVYHDGSKTPASALLADIPEEEYMRASAKTMMLNISIHTVAQLSTSNTIAMRIIEMGLQKHIIEMCFQLKDYNYEGQEFAAKALASIAESGACVPTLVSMGAIDALLVLFKSGEMKVHEEAARALANLGRDNVEYQAEIAAKGGIKILVSFLKVYQQANVVTQICRALYLLSQPPQNKREIIDRDGLRPLITNSFSIVHSVRLNCALVLKSLSALDDYRTKMVEEGVYAPLISMLRSSDLGLCLQAALCIARLTDSDNQRTNDDLVENDESLEIILDILKSTKSEEIIVQMLIIIGNIGSSPLVSAAIGRYPGTLSRICELAFSDKIDIKLQAMRTAGILCNNETNAHTIVELCNVYALKVFLNQHNLSLTRYTVQLLANASCHALLRPKFIRANVLGACYQYLEDSDPYLRRAALKLLQNMSSDEKIRVEVMNKDGIALLMRLADTEILGRTPPSTGRSSGSDISNQESTGGEHGSARNLHRMNKHDAAHVQIQNYILLALHQFLRDEKLLKVIMKSPWLDILFATLRSDEHTNELRSLAAQAIAIISSYTIMRSQVLLLDGANKLISMTQHLTKSVRQTEEEILAIQQEIENFHRAEEERRKEEERKQLARTANLVQLRHEADKLPTDKSQSTKTKSTVEMEKSIISDKLQSFSVSVKQDDIANLRLKMKGFRVVQRFCLKSLFFLTESETVRDRCIKDWSWDVFTEPLPFEETQKWACKLCFRISVSSKKLPSFVNTGAVFYVVKSICVNNMKMTNLAIASLATIAASEKFHEAIINEGGIATVMPLIYCEDQSIVREAFKIISLLTRNGTMADYVMNEGLSSKIIEMYPSVEDAQLLRTLITIIGILLEYDKHRQQVAQEGGVEMILSCCTNPNQQVLTHAMKCLSTIATKDEVQRVISESAYLPMLFNQLSEVKIDTIECLADALRIVYNLSIKDSLRLKLAQFPYKDFILPLLSLLYEDRLTIVNDQQVPPAVAKDIQSYAIQILANMSYLDEVRVYLASADQEAGLQMLLRWAGSSEFTMKWNAARIITNLCRIEANHAYLLQPELGVMNVLLLLAKSDNVETKKQAAIAFHSLANNNEVQASFERRLVIETIVSMCLGAKVKEIRHKCSHTLMQLSESNETVQSILLTTDNIGTVIGTLLGDNEEAIKLTGLHLMANLARSKHFAGATGITLTNSFSDILPLFKSTNRQTRLTTVRLLRSLADCDVFRDKIIDDCLRPVRSLFNTDHPSIKRECVQLFSSLSVTDTKKLLLIRTLTVEVIMTLMKNYAENNDFEMIRRCLRIVANASCLGGNFKEQLVREHAVEVIMPLILYPPLLHAHDIDSDDDDDYYNDTSEEDEEDLDEYNEHRRLVAERQQRQQQMNDEIRSTSLFILANLSEGGPSCRTPIWQQFNANTVLLMKFLLDRSSMKGRLQYEMCRILANVTEDEPEVCAALFKQGVVDILNQISKTPIIGVSTEPPPPPGAGAGAGAWSPTASTTSPTNGGSRPRDSSSSSSSYYYTNVEIRWQAQAALANVFVQGLIMTQHGGGTTTTAPPAWMDRLLAQLTNVTAKDHPTKRLEAAKTIAVLSANEERRKEMYNLRAQLIPELVHLTRKDDVQLQAYALHTILNLITKPTTTDNDNNNSCSGSGTSSSGGGLVAVADEVFGIMIREGIQSIVKIANHLGGGSDDDNRFMASKILARMLRHKSNLGAIVLANKSNPLEHVIYNV